MVSFLRTCRRWEGTAGKDGELHFQRQSNRKQQRVWEATSSLLLEHESERGWWQEENSGYLIFFLKIVHSARMPLLVIDVTRTSTEVVLIFFSTATVKSQSICWPDFENTTASVTKSGESRTKGTVDHRVSLPEVRGQGRNVLSKQLVSK